MERTGQILTNFIIVNGGKCPILGKKVKDWDYKPNASSVPPLKI